MTPACTAPAPDDGAVIWQGFEHHWNYNHRWNRVGSWIEPLDGECVGPVPEGSRCTFDRVHSFASGTGPDEVRAVGAWQEVRAPGVGFRSAADLEHSVQGVDFEPVSEQRTVVIDVSDEPGLQDRARYGALLAGWDLLDAGEGARKPMSFGITILGEPQYSPADQSVTIDWQLDLNQGCTTLECFNLDEHWSYTLNTRFLLVAWDDELEWTAGRAARSSSWDRETELALEPLVGSLEGPSATDVATVGITGFRIDLEGEDGGPEECATDIHLLVLQGLLALGDYDGSRYAYEHALAFKNWAEGMEDYNLLSGASHRCGGSAELSTDLALLQLGGGASVTATGSPCAYSSEATNACWTWTRPWEGGDAQADTEDAVIRGTDPVWGPGLDPITLAF